MQGLIFLVASVLCLIYLDYHVNASVCLTGNVTGYRVEDCSKGWVRYGSVKCFKFIATRLDYVSARKSCESLDATLACLASAEEHEFLKSYILSQYKTTAELVHVWIGGEARASRWFWTDLSPFNYSSWVEDDSAQRWDDGQSIALATSKNFVNETTGKPDGESNWGEMFSSRAIASNNSSWSISRTKPYICQKFQTDVRTVVKI